MPLQCLEDEADRLHCGEFIAAVIETDRWVTVSEPTTTHDLPLGTIRAIINDDLGLVKKFTHWVPKLLSTDQKRSEWTAATTSWTSFGSTR